MKRIICLICFLLLSLLSSNPVERPSIRGTVYDETGMPVIGAVITLINVNSGQLVASTLSNMDGTFYLTGFTPSLHAYILRACYIGYSCIEVACPTFYGQTDVTFQPDESML